MLNLFPEYLEQIRSEALEAFPEEGAWLITKKGCTRVDNISETPEETFDIGERDIARAHRDGLLAVVHSHVNDKHYPSKMDMQYQINTNVPWGLVLCDGVASSRITWWGSDDQREDLVNRTFCHGVTDCFSLLQDYYHLNFGIEIPHMPREWQWWNTDKNFMLDGLEKTGFVKIQDLPSPQDIPRPGDVWLASIGVRDGALTHCGILLENGLTHHHPGTGRPVDHTKKAAVEPISRFMQIIGLWVRHKERL
ncbi:putative tail assembly protein [Pseudomonas phage UAntarctica]|nr:putative tail assembly protein [Pseudomonas phage UAntarctica]